MRNWPASTMCPRSRFVAATRRASTWIGRYYRLVGGYLPESGETMIYVVMSRLVLCHLAHPAPYSIANPRCQGLRGLARTFKTASRENAACETGNLLYVVIGGLIPGGG